MTDAVTQCIASEPLHALHLHGKGYFSSFGLDITQLRCFRSCM